MSSRGEKPHLRVVRNDADGRERKPSLGSQTGPTEEDMGGGGQPPTTPPGKTSIKHRAKRFNEQLKAAYGFLNTLAAAVIVTGYISPTINNQPLPFGLDTAGLVLIGIGIHCAGQALLFFFTRREE